MIAEGVGELEPKKTTAKSVVSLPTYFLEAADCQEGTHNAWLIRTNTVLTHFFSRHTYKEIAAQVS